MQPARRRPGDERGAPAARSSGARWSSRTGDDVHKVPPGNPQRVVGVVVANGGTATFDQLSEAMWPGEDLDVSRPRLRNVLLRLRRAVGDVVVRSGTGVRLADEVVCDLLDFDRLALDALSSARADPELAGRVAAEAVRAGEGTVFAGFEYEEWAIAARRSAEQRMIGLLDLLSVQAEDAGDLPAAQSLAERALRLDRYTDSRYVRLAELLTLQHRVAAAIAVLDDAAEVGARDRRGTAGVSDASPRRPGPANGYGQLNASDRSDLEEPRPAPDARQTRRRTGRAFATRIAIRRKRRDGRTRVMTSSWGRRRTPGVPRRAPDGIAR